MEKPHASGYAGRGCLRLSKKEAHARAALVSTPAETAYGDSAVTYILAESKHVSLLPENCLRIGVAATRNVIQNPFCRPHGRSAADAYRREIGAMRHTARSATRAATSRWTAVNRQKPLAKKSCGFAESSRSLIS